MSLFLEEAWLRRVSGDEPLRVDGSAQERAGAFKTDGERRLRDACHAASANGAIRFRCQATELLKATYPLSVLRPSQYICDVRSNGVTWARAARGIVMSLVNRCLRSLGRPTLPRVVGTLRRTSQVELGLQTGDWVEVRPHQEIVATLDPRGKNRGLSFDSEMIPYCGGRFRVLRRVETIVDEQTGELRRLPGVCIVLEGVVCRGIYHRSCPRSIYPYWREIWLRRVGEEV